ncbi:AGAP011137-PA-like protein [Anopheles sinensis]|uniref:Ketimine reductase mu-crystallin n=1 Tax=Anopheles sinensis TaxID=74873 RepID=A0A084WLZ1_ANOSI|nr:AGAP011137-PA-like protein [Anopheles sinensis]
MSKQNVGTNTNRPRPVFIDEDQVKQLLDWDEARLALEQAFVSVSNQAREPSARSTEHPVSSQPARTFVQAEGGVLLCMPGFVGHHQLTSDSPERGSTLACKLITSFRNNASVGLPSINGEVFVFNSTTGKLEAIVEANYLTGVRTATASLVATDHLYLRPTATLRNAAPIKLGIVAVGAGEYHHAELAQDIYDSCRVYIDHWEGARKELATLRSNVVGEVGEIILGDAGKLLPAKPGGITVFQSLGMATEDATVGRLVYERFAQAQQRYTMEK